METITLSCNLDATPEQIYTAWLSSERHSEMTGGEAKMTTHVGDVFSAWDGYISGKNLELTPNNYIKQAWRTTEFGEGDPNSIIEVFLEVSGEGTKLTLNHSNIPDGQADMYESGWVDHYFEPMGEYFELAREL